MPSEAGNCFVSYSASGDGEILRSIMSISDAREPGHFPAKSPFPQVDSSGVASLEQDGFLDGGISLPGLRMLAPAAAMKARQAPIDFGVTLEAAQQERQVESTRSTALSGLQAVCSW